jgi:hypothetical protein
MVNLCLREALQGRIGNAILFFEDLPYAAERDPLILASLTSFFPSTTRYYPLRLPGSALQDKLKLVNLYPSQIERHHLHALRRHWKEVRGEVIWAPDGLALTP